MKMEYKKVALSENVEEMFIGPFGSSLKNECFVDEEQAYCVVYEQKHAIQKTMNVKARYVDEKKYKELKRFNVKGGDIIVSCRGTIGETFVVPEDAPLGIMHPSIMKIRLKDGVYDKYYFNSLLKMRLKKHEAEANGSGIKMAISATELGKELFPVPTLDEQKQIKNVLSGIENLICKRKEELRLLDDLIKARFVEMFGDPITNTKCLDTKELKDVLVLKAGDFTAASDISDEPSETNIYPCYGGNGIRGYVAEYNQDGEYSLVGRQGALSGNVQYARGKFKNTEHALLVTPIIEMNSIWLNQLLFNLDLKRYQTGAAQPGLSVKNLQEIQIIMVPLAEQIEFANFVEQTNKSKVAVQKALDEALLLFDKLMQDYFG